MTEIKKATPQELPKELKIVKMIRTQTKVGSGIGDDVQRLVYQYWDFKGNLIFTFDPFFLGRELPYDEPEDA